MSSEEGGKAAPLNHHHTGDVHVFVHHVDESGMEPEAPVDTSAFPHVTTEPFPRTGSGYMGRGGGPADPEPHTSAPAYIAEPPSAPEADARHAEFLRWVRDIGGAALAAIFLVAAAALVIWFVRWVHDYDWNSSASPAPAVATTTMPQLLKSEGFAVKGHSLCAVYPVDGTAYRVQLNRGRGCQHVVQLVVGASAVQIFSTKYIHTSTVDLGYANDKYVVGSSRLEIIRRQSLGDQLINNLRVITLRLTPNAAKALRAEPQG